MFPFGRLHTASRVLAVLLLQAGQAEAAGEEEADDEDPHDEMTVVPGWVAGWLGGVRTCPDSSHGTTNYY